jgi:hypothetical protein
MTRNPLWRGSADPQAAEFAEALHSLESSYCAVADLHALWRQILEKKDYYDLTTPIRDYDIDFIEGCLIEAWPEVNKLAQTKINDLPF